MNKYSTRSIKEVDRKKWDEFVNKHELGTVFHTSYMYDVWMGVPGYEPFALCVVNDKDNILALMSGFIQTVSPGLLSYLSRRSVLLQGPLYSDPKSLEILLGAYIKLIKKKVVYTEIRNHYKKDEYQKLMSAHGYKWEGHYNIVKELPSMSQELWSQINRKRKDGINKAKRFDFSLKTDIQSNSVAEFYELLGKKYKTLGLPIPPKVFFQNCVDKDKNSYCRYFQLIHESQVSVSLLAFVYKGILHAVYIGNETDTEFIKMRPVDWFYYKVMEHCIENGVRFFDWMGAGKPDVPYGVRDFKLQYGGELEDFGRFIYLHRPASFRFAQLGFTFLRKFREKRKK